MAFNIANFGRGTMNCNVAGPTMHMYNSGADNNATVVAVSYFDAVADLLKENDTIYVVTTAGAAINNLQVTDITAGVVTTTAFDTDVGAGAIGTANIAALAVTGDKIDNATIAVGKMVANTLTSAAIATDVIQYVKVPVTAAQLNGAYAAPFVLIAAPGANKLVVVHDVMFEVDYGSAPFANGGAAALQYDNTANGAGVLASATIAAATINAFVADGIISVRGAAASATAAATVNKGIYLSNLTGAFITGTGTVLDLHISYSIVTTTL